ncbi:hypothetical protein L3Q82_001233 [Scortum barcoo]|uniref:Uncharacterized protein n=1 Tax=Scortum barcoo TaxID=214431 RepID=A0ACB8W741_9TELE|nr:hypothetical protein L3Q82_001233 [Scortum barcoo]
MSHREEASGKTQDTLERLCLSAGLGTPRGPPGRAGGSVWGEGSLGISAQTAASIRDPVPDQADEEDEDEVLAVDMNSDWMGRNRVQSASDESHEAYSRHLPHSHQLGSRVYRTVGLPRDSGERVEVANKTHNHSAFNTIVPSKLITKLRDLGLNTALCDWILNFRTGRKFRIG